MEIQETGIDRCRVFSIDRYEDERGYFQEIYNENRYDDPGPLTPQVSFSKSHCDVLRGIHVSPYGKLCTCVRGSLWDVVVDLRYRSSTFGKWFGVELTEENHKQLYVPAYCGHGFLSLEDDTCLLYMQGGRWSTANDGGIKWNDCKVGIEWPLPVHKYLISEKDQEQPSLEEYVDSEPIFNQ